MEPILPVDRVDFGLRKHSKITHFKAKSGVLNRKENGVDHRVVTDILGPVGDQEYMNCTK